MNHWFISKIPIPFKKPFKHTAKTRVETESIFIKVSNEKGLNGFGESCPRSYVTQESSQSVVDSVTSFLKNRKPPVSIEELISWRNEFYQQFSNQYAAWCAIELAGLDLLAKQDKKSIFHFLNCGFIHTPQYSAVIGIDFRSGFLWKALRYRLYGMQQFKIKISGQFSDDLWRMKVLSVLGFKNNQIRVDANNYFSDKQLAIDYIKNLSNYFWAIEEPVASRNIEELVEISFQTGKAVILDETIDPDNIVEQLERLASAKIILNLRISRLGGLLSSLQIAQECTKQKVPYLIGTHVGETSLLNRAALALCGKNIGQAVAIEGGFSDRLLKFDPAVPKVAFGYKGKIQNVAKVKSLFGISTLNLKQWNII